MDLGFLNEYAVSVIVGICICMGYIIKTSFSSIDNKYIPLIMAILGVVLNVWINMNITPEIILAGMFSGLASTGLYEAFRNLIGGNK